LIDESPATVSIVIPAYNEQDSIGDLVRALAAGYPDYEILVVDDGSTDATAEQAEQAGARVVRHPYNKGNGAAIKTGAREACGDTLVFLDADGQHRGPDVLRLLNRLAQGFDMVVGSRRAGGQASVSRFFGNALYNSLGSWVVGQRIEDLTSGFRVVNARKFREFLFLLPNGFSYPTTITLAFFRSGYSVAYEPIEVYRRSGKSHIRLGRDGIKFLLIIFRVCTLYSPFKLFLPVALAQFALGAGYYLFTFATSGRFTNMSSLLLTSSMTTFLIGLISEEIPALLYKHDSIDSG
jgi:glycosyltransferase involved in cell wall biosynthesis